MDIEQDRLHNFGMMYSGDEDPGLFEEAYYRVNADPWASLENSLSLFRSRQVDRLDLPFEGKRNLEVMGAVLRRILPFYDGLPITISYHGSTLYGSPVKGDMDYMIIIDPRVTNRNVYQDVSTLNTQIENQLLRLGIQPDSIVVENRGLEDGRFVNDDCIKLLTAMDIAIFTQSEPIIGLERYEEIYGYYMDLLYSDPDILLLTAAIQDEILRYNLGRRIL